MIIPHYRPMPSHDPKAFRVGDAKLHSNNHFYIMSECIQLRLIYDMVQGGGVVRLFHRENECYVCAEGSFSDAFKRENECYTGAPEEY